jgi:acetyl/propionyl-CoA carboxylase alpha subunit
MNIKKLLIANRGEVAVRVMRTAADLGIETVAVYSADDQASMHRERADSAVVLNDSGVRAYLDGPAIISAALASGCDAIHPGWGFLSESADFAQACQTHELKFVGPPSEQLAQLGDKLAGRALAQANGVPVLTGREERKGRAFCSYVTPMAYPSSHYVTRQATWSVQIAKRPRRCGAGRA